MCGYYISLCLPLHSHLKIFSLCQFSKQYFGTLSFLKSECDVLNFFIWTPDLCPLLPCTTPPLLSSLCPVPPPTSVPFLNLCPTFPQPLAIPSPTFHLLPLYWLFSLSLSAGLPIFKTQKLWKNLLMYVLFWVFEGVDHVSCLYSLTSVLLVSCHLFSAFIVFSNTYL